jgi:hypothetical protein
MLTHSDEIACLEQIMRENRACRLHNHADEVRFYQLQNDAGLANGPILRMTQSDADFQNRLRGQDIERAEALVTAARKQREAARNYEERMDRLEDAYRASVGFELEERKAKPLLISDAEKSARKFLEENRSYLWTLVPDVRGVGMK